MRLERLPSSTCLQSGWCLASQALAANPSASVKNSQRLPSTGSSFPTLISAVYIPFLSLMQKNGFDLCVILHNSESTCLKSSNSGFGIVLSEAELTALSGVDVLELTGVDFQLPVDCLLTCSLILASGDTCILILVASSGAPPSLTCPTLICFDFPGFPPSASLVDCCFGSSACRDHSSHKELFTPGQKQKRSEA